MLRKREQKKKQTKKCVCCVCMLCEEGGRESRAHFVFHLTSSGTSACHTGGRGDRKMGRSLCIGHWGNHLADRVWPLGHAKVTWPVLLKASGQPAEDVYK